MKKKQIIALSVLFVIVLSVVLFDRLPFMNRATFMIDVIAFDEETGQGELVCSGGVPGKFTVKTITKTAGKITTVSSGSGDWFLFQKNHEGNFLFCIDVKEANKRQFVLVKEKQEFQLRAGERFDIYKFTNRAGELKEAYIELEERK
jgi:hypothetical protein